MENGEFMNELACQFDLISNLPGQICFLNSQFSILNSQLRNLLYLLKSFFLVLTAAFLTAKIIILGPKQKKSPQWDF
ncbi:hypothetical protein [Eubacterium maltosivorans]|uniref:Uncharacterized protein n=1 Tax=Eubacterium maltosivorans TaxID=2041044 RepID=A0A4P9CCZ0_EUBML|nr:hypothetical protein [Eubacterium maltosivorans]QCT73527.1 hypothetical protein CPZ25_020195 [Eubacterium maltosivorans]